MRHLEQVPDQRTRTKPNRDRSLRLRIAGIAATAIAFAWALLSGYHRVQAERSGTPWETEQTLLAVGVSILVLSVAGGLFRAAKRNDSNETDDDR